MRFLAARSGKLKQVSRMLDLTMGGQMVSGPDAIEFMEGLYEVRKSVPVPVKVTKLRYTTYDCGQCGHGVRPGDAYCSQCGRKIGWR